VVEHSTHIPKYKLLSPATDIGDRKIVKCLPNWSQLGVINGRESVVNRVLDGSKQGILKGEVSLYS